MVGVFCPIPLASCWAGLERGDPAASQSTEILIWWNGKFQVHFSTSHANACNIFLRRGSAGERFPGKADFGHNRSRYGIPAFRSVCHMLRQSVANFRCFLGCFFSTHKTQSVNVLSKFQFLFCRSPPKVRRVTSLFGFKSLFVCVVCS